MSLTDVHGRLLLSEGHDRRGACLLEGSHSSLRPIVIANWSRIAIGRLHAAIDSLRDADTNANRSTNDEQSNDSSDNQLLALAHPGERVPALRAFLLLLSLRVLLLRLQTRPHAIVATVALTTQRRLCKAEVCIAALALKIVCIRLRHFKIGRGTVGAIKVVERVARWLRGCRQGTWWCVSRCKRQRALVLNRRTKRGFLVLRHCVCVAVLVARERFLSYSPVPWSETCRSGWLRRTSYICVAVLTK